VVLLLNVLMHTLLWHVFRTYLNIVAEHAAALTDVEESIICGHWFCKGLKDMCLALILFHGRELAVSLCPALWTLDDT